MKVCTDPEKMLGYCDQFAGSDYDDPLSLKKVRKWAAIVYCKVCHKTHAPIEGEEPCGEGAWILDQDAEIHE